MKNGSNRCDRTSSESPGPSLSNACRNRAACRVEAGCQPEHPASWHGHLQRALVVRLRKTCTNAGKGSHLDRGQIGLQVELDANLLLAGAVLGEARSRPQGPPPC